MGENKIDFKYKVKNKINDEERNQNIIQSNQDMTLNKAILIANENEKKLLNKKIWNVDLIYNTIIKNKNKVKDYINFFED